MSKPWIEYATSKIREYADFMKLDFVREDEDKNETKMIYDVKNFAGSGLIGYRIDHNARWEHFDASCFLMLATDFENISDPCEKVCRRGERHGIVATFNQFRTGDHRNFLRVTQRLFLSGVNYEVFSIVTRNVVEFTQELVEEMPEIFAAEPYMP